MYWLFYSLCKAFLWTLMAANACAFVSQIHHREDIGMTNLIIKQAMEARQYIFWARNRHIRATWHLVLSCWQLWRFLYVAMSDTIRHQKELLIFSWTTVSTSTVSNWFTNHNTASSETVLFMYIGFCVAFNFITYLNSHSVIDSI